MSGQPNGLALTEKEEEEMRALFSTAESAMEAWAMLANAIGHPTFIKSEFEKICFLDNEETDTQASLYTSFSVYLLNLVLRYLMLELFLLLLLFDYTQVAIWRDLDRRRLVIAFRGTEQVGFIISLIGGRNVVYDFLVGISNV